LKHEEIRKLNSGIFPYLLVSGLVLVKYALPLQACKSWIATELGDNTAGIPFWNVWEALRVGNAPAIGAPEGFDPSPQKVQFVTSWITIQITGAMGRLLGPICGFNFSALLLTMVTSLSFYWLFRNVFRAHWIVAVASTAFIALGPFSTFVGNTHVQWLGSFPVVVAFGGFLKFLIGPQPGWGLLVGFAIFLSFLSEPHMPVATAAVLFSVVVAALLSGLLQPNRLKNIGNNRQTLGVVALVASTLLGLFLVAISLRRVSKQEGSLGLPERTADDLWGVSIQEYFSSGLASRLTTLIDFERVMQRTPDGAIAAQYFMGFAALLGIVMALLLFARKATLREDTEQRLLFLSGVALVLVGFILSAPPQVAFGGFEVPMLPAFVVEVMPSIRFYWRFLYVVLLGAVCLGVLGWSWQLQESKRTGRNVLSVILLSLLVLDVFGYKPFMLRGFDFTRTPDVYQWLSTQKLAPGEFVAELVWDYPGYVSWQPIHEKPLINGGEPGSGRVLALQALDGFVHPQTPCLANSLGARFLLRHNGAEPIPAFEGQRLVESFRFTQQASGWPVAIQGEYANEKFWYDVDVYENDGISSTNSYVAYGPGFAGGTWDDPYGFSVMPGQEGILSIRALPRRKTDSDEISFSMRSAEQAQDVSVTRFNGELIWSGQLSGEWVEVRFRSPGDEFIRIVKNTSSPESALWVGNFATGECVR